MFCYKAAHTYRAFSLTSLTPRRVWLFLALMLLMRSWPLSAQDGRIQVAAHVGVIEDGRGLIGGQLAVRLMRQITTTLAGTEVLNVGPHSHLRNWEVSIRLTPWDRRVKPYLFGGPALQNSSTAGIGTRNDFGVVVGAGVEGGTGPFRPFGEARVIKTAGAAGFFWVGIRLHLAR